MNRICDRFLETCDRTCDRFCDRFVFSKAVTKKMVTKGLGAKVRFVTDVTAFEKFSEPTRKIARIFDDLSRVRRVFHVMRVIRVRSALDSKKRSQMAHG